MLTIIDLLLKCLRVSDGNLCFNGQFIHAIGKWKLGIKTKISNPPKHLHIKHEFCTYF